METRAYDDYLHERLKAPEFTAEFLTAAVDDEEPVVFLSALCKVAEVRGMAEVARKIGAPHESLYCVLSAKCNPRWSTLATLVRATELKIAVTAL